MRITKPQHMEMFFVHQTFQTRNRNFLNKRYYENQFKIQKIMFDLYIDVSVKIKWERSLLIITKPHHLKG